MRVKKFEAKSMKEALQMVKNELGPDAVILAARDNNRGYGIKGGPSVEITAAVSESTLQKKHFVESRLTSQDRERFMKSDARTQRQIINKMVDNRVRDTAEKQKRPITSVSYIDIQDEELEAGSRRVNAMELATGRNVADLLSGFDQDFDMDEWKQSTTREVASNPPVVQSSERAVKRIRNAAREAWKNNPFIEDESAHRAAQPRSATPTRSGTLPTEEMRDLDGSSGRGRAVESRAREVLSAPVPAPRSGVSAAVVQPVPADIRDSEIHTLKNEINRLQKMLESINKVPQTFVGMHPGADYGIPYDLSFMFQKLVESGVTVDNTVEILQQAAKEIDPVQLKKRPIIDAWVARWFLNHVSIVKTPWAGRVHLFVGGAGSGKTSSLVKMASQLVVKEKKRIAILSTDAFKVGAVDQLKIYCQILNVPFAVIRNRKDWEWIMSQLRNVDHILVDFPGLQLRDLDEIHLLKSLLPPEGVHPTCHFCISATSKDGDAYEIARRYRVADFHDIIFTNLDQSVQHGIIYNLQKKVQKPLHSFGIGNRLPEDFEPASKERVLDLIFKLTKLKRETR